MTPAWGSWQPSRTARYVLSGRFVQASLKLAWKVCCRQMSTSNAFASRVLMQYATLAKGDKTVADRLVQDLLFSALRPRTLMVRARPPCKLCGTHLRWTVSSLWITKRCVLVVRPALLAQTRKRIAAATETWSALAGGDRNKIKPAADQFSLVCDSLRKLNPGSEPGGRTDQNPGYHHPHGRATIGRVGHGSGDIGAVSAGSL